MNKDTNKLVNTLVRVCVFLYTAQYWEDYQSMRLEDKPLNALKEWLNGTQGYDLETLDKIFLDIPISQFNALKTDWTIGLLQVINAVNQLSQDEKIIASKYIDELIPVALKNHTAVAKAIKTLKISE